MFRGWWNLLRYLEEIHPFSRRATTARTISMYSRVLLAIVSSLRPYRANDRDSSFNSTPDEKATLSIDGEAVAPLSAAFHSFHPRAERVGT